MNTQYKQIRESLEQRQVVHEILFGLVDVPVIDELVGTVQDTAETAITGIAKALQKTGESIGDPATMFDGPGKEEAAEAVVQISKGNTSPQVTQKIIQAKPVSKAAEKTVESIKNKAGLLDFLKNNKRNVMIAAAVVSGAGLAGLSIQLYKAYWKQAASKVCATKKDKTKCVANYKKKAIKTMTMKLNRIKSKLTKLPAVYMQKAVKRIDKIIDSFDKKLKKITG